MTMPPLTDRQRVELAIPSRLTFALVLANCFGPDPDADPVAAKAEMDRNVARLKTILARACVEPLEDLTPREYGKLSRRIDRVAAVAIAEWNDVPALSIAMALYYFLKDLIDRGILVLWDGSAMGEATDILIPMFEHGFTEARLDQSAQKRARRLLRHLQGEGYYRDMPAPCAAAGMAVSA